MSEDRRLPLWSLSARPSGPPTLEQARKTLGGPWVGGGEAEHGVGCGVAVEPVGTLGVVLHAEPGRRDIWIGGGRIQRVDLLRLRACPAPELREVARDARRFLALRAGEAIAYRSSTGAAAHGVLTEKLRYGGLVSCADGRTVAVSFRRLAPRSEPPG